MGKLKPLNEYTQADFDAIWLKQLEQAAEKLGLEVNEITIFDGQDEYSTPDGKRLVTISKGGDMAVIGRTEETTRIVVDPPHDIKICDICSEDATGRTPCRVCKKDLCSTHQLQLRSDLENADWDRPEREALPGGIYCSPCLIEKIKETFK